MEGEFTLKNKILGHQTACVSELPLKQPLVGQNVK